MPEITTDDGCRLHYQLDGREDGPLLVFANSLGTALAMWDPQVPSLGEHFRILRFDARGHGLSGIGAGAYGIDRLGRDVLSLLDHLGVAKAHFCGLSMSGMVGIWLGRQAPERCLSLALCNTAALIGSKETWEARIAAVMAQGTAGITDAVIDRWFTEPFRARAPAEVARIAVMLRTTPSAGYAAACAAIRDADLRAELGAIAVRTLVIAGTFDQSTTAADGRFLAQGIPGARYAELASAHLSNIEAAGDFTRTLSDFLSS